ncbi:MAG: hypothetical protein HON07_06635 [Planctomycetaceae bacterium]|nr:hypothetical protein [Planctomycetaceae bacterium]
MFGRIVCIQVGRKCLTSAPTDTIGTLSGWQRFYDEYIKAESRRRHEARPASTVTNLSRDTGQNDPCPCGSVKKFKRCCGAY